MSRLSHSQVLFRYACIALTLAALAAAFAWTAGWIHWPGAQAALTPSRLIDAFERSAGKHPGFRRNHAKGICVSGYFDSNGNGAALSRASVFERGRTPLIGRFSAPGGNPAEDDANTTVRSFALLFAMRDGEQWRTGMNSAPVFAVRTPHAVYELQEAMQNDKRTGRPDAAKLDAFFAQHPETNALRDWLAAHPPASAFYNASYYSIDAFRFTNASGDVRFVRWSVVPDAPYAPYAPVDTRSPSASDPDFLAHGLRVRLQSGPVSWHLMLTPAGAGDPVDDATRAWPAERERHRVDAGTIVIDHAQAQIDGACRDINFDPTVLPVGIAPSDDPLLAARAAAYAVSFDRRTSEEAQAGVKGH
ncbi:MULTISPECIES: catalase family peroxidase [unclassified Paraburkholderia]|uniref:catalase family peroxidase n=1 Tax=unclassified Paraburkholderia TaxID=2615204 RepID=UPI002AB7CECD|nr:MULTISPECIES: catalase family peroxidase [unclassified Paraburkholderia]